MKKRYLSWLLCLLMIWPAAACKKDGESAPFAGNTQQTESKKDDETKKDETPFESRVEAEKTSKLSLAPAPIRKHGDQEDPSPETSTEAAERTAETSAAETAAETTAPSTAETTASQTAAAETTAQSTAETTASQTAAAETTEAPAETENAEVSLSLSTEEISESSEQAGEGEGFKVEIPKDFKPVKAFENEFLKVTLKSIKDDEIWGFTLVLELANKDGQPIRFSISQASINGLMNSPFASVDIPANETLELPVCWTKSFFEENQFSKVYKVAMHIKAYRTEPKYEAVADGCFDLFPYGSEAYQPHVRTEAEKQGFVLIDEENLAYAILQKVYKEGESVALRLYLENPTDKILFFEISNAKVNGKDLDPFWGTLLLPGSRSTSSVFWSADMLKEAGIASANVFELPFSISDHQKPSDKPLFEKSLKVELQDE